MEINLKADSIFPEVKYEKNGLIYCKKSPAGWRGKLISSNITEYE